MSNLIPVYFYVNDKLEKWVSLSYEEIDNNKLIIHMEKEKADNLLNSADFSEYQFIFKKLINNIIKEW